MSHSVEDLGRLLCRRRANFDASTGCRVGEVGIALMARNVAAMAPFKT